MAWTLGWLLLGFAAWGQEPSEGPEALRPDWRHIGNSAIELYLASPATGPVEKAWFAENGARLFVLTATGTVLETEDFETWKRNPAEQPPEDDSSAFAAASSTPESGATIRPAGGFSPRLYAMGRDVYRSDDDGAHWINLTRFRQESIIGGGMKDLAASPSDPDEVVAVNDYGVWRSLDGGLSWTGLNESLPNLPVRRILATPVGTSGIRILVEGAGPMEWAPGEKLSWRSVSDSRHESEEAALRAARTRLGESVSAVAIGDLYSYAGALDGRLWISTDKGLTWIVSREAGRGPIEALRVDREDSRLALAAIGAVKEGNGYPRVLRTFNGGLFWDDLTSDLPPGSVHGLAMDRTSGAIYAAVDGGVFLTFADPLAAGPTPNWIPMSGNLPAAPVADVMLDPAGNQLYVALRGYGVYAAPAPHRYWSLRVVNAADLSVRAAAPGSLLSVLGARLLRAQAGLVDAPILHASELESQIQVPFEASGISTRLSLEAARGRFTFELPLREVSPAIFVDRDGAPLLLDADSGLVVDALNPARSNSRIQILATGLGKVEPAWPTGRAAPLETPPKVVAPVRVFVDRNPVEVTRAILAPGYIGFYLVEVQLPALVNAGPAGLYVEAEGGESNHVRIYLEP